jgi:hypothetical protein
MCDERHDRMKQTEWENGGMGEWEEFEDGGWRIEDRASSVRHLRSSILDPQVFAHSCSREVDDVLSNMWN